MTRRLALAIVLAAAVVPRLVVLLSERGRILEELVEKSDRFAQTLVASGTFGFLPNRPSGYTQPLYAWFLAGLYQVLERHWLVVGIAHIVVAALTAVVVFEIGRRVVSTEVGLLGALIATLHPFLVWHDMHLNREILDGLLVAVVALLAWVTVERRAEEPKLQVVTSAFWLGLALGLAILGNARLALLPLVLAVYVAWPFLPAARTLLCAGAVILGAAVVVTPWIARNEASVGCFVLTTDTRALWKANNENTRRVLDDGGWIDDVPEPPGAPPWPELAADLTLAGTPTEVDECAQQRYYRELVTDFWREEPGEKARLAAQAVRMLWSPTFSRRLRGRGARAARGARTRPRRAALHGRGVRACARRRLPRAAPLPRARAPARGLQHGRRDGLRRNGALPGALRLPARAPRRCGPRSRVGAASAAPSVAAARMKVLHIQRIGGIGGSERHVLELLPALRERGVDVSFLGLDDTSAAAPGTFYDALAARGVSFERIPCPRDVDPVLAWRVRRAVRRAGPDLLHTHLVHADVYGALAVAGTRTTLVSTKHNDDPFRSGRFRRLERLLTRRAALVVCITDALARFNRETVGLPAEKLRVVHYGLDAPPEPWGPPGGPELPAEVPVLLAVCRLVPQKGVDVAIEALARVRERHDARLVVLGEGPLRAELEARAASLGVADAVSLPGRVGDVAWWLRRATVVVHPVRWEGFGLALLEAMLCCAARRRLRGQLGPGDRRGRRDGVARPA